MARLRVLRLACLAAVVGSGVVEVATVRTFGVMVGAGVLPAFSFPVLGVALAADRLLGLTAATKVA